jgi:hypothetical protein
MRLILPIIALALSAPALAETPAEQAVGLEVIRAGDLRVATVGERLAVANLPLCGRTEYRTGLLLHDIRTYSAGMRDAARKAFAFERDIAVEAVVPGSPAERAGLRPNESVVAIDGRPVADVEAPGKDSFARMGAVLDRLEASLADGHVSIETLKDGQRRDVTIDGVRGCASRFQLVLDGQMNAGADGQYVQVDGRMVDFAENDDELAAVLAHELAHNILEHRRRLNAAGVDRGMLGVLGRSGALIRATEIEADRLSLYLMANAGYDPAAAVGFWDRLGAKHGYGIFSDGTHLRRGPRVAMVRRELTALEALRAKAGAGAVLFPDFARPPLPTLRAN